MSKTIRNYKRYQNFEETDRCEYCRYKTRKGKKRGCNRAVCYGENIRTDAIRNDRIKRERGWSKRQMSTEAMLWDG